MKAVFSVPWKQAYSWETTQNIHFELFLWNNRYPNLTWAAVRTQVHGGCCWGGIQQCTALCLSCHKTFLKQPWERPLRNTGHSQHSCPMFTSPSWPSSASNFSLELPLIYSHTSTSSKATVRRLPGFQLSSMIMVKGMVSRAHTYITAHQC